MVPEPLKLHLIHRSDLEILDREDVLIIILLSGLGPVVAPP